MLADEETHPPPFDFEEVPGQSQDRPRTESASVKLQDMCTESRDPSDSASDLDAAPACLRYFCLINQAGGVDSPYTVGMTDVETFDDLFLAELCRTAPEGPSDDHLPPVPE